MNTTIKETPENHEKPETSATLEHPGADEKRTEHTKPELEPDTNHSVAVFIDLENIYYSVYNSFSEHLNWSYIVDLCKQYGRISSIQAFGDWIDFQDELRKVQKNGIQPVFVPSSRNSKSSLDCYLTVSAMKMLFQNNTIETIILASGDRDYIPLIAELKALGRKVRILAIPDTLSSDLRSVADGLIEYESQSKGVSLIKSETSVTNETEEFIVDVLSELESSSSNDRWVNLAAIGLKLSAKDPDFSHKSYGFEKLADLLDAIDSIELKYDNDEKTIALARVREDEGQGAEAALALGTVFSIKDGYGFILPDDGGENIFFHCSKVNSDFNELMRGDRVSYNTYETDRGVNAGNVEKASS